MRSYLFVPLLIAISLTGCKTIHYERAQVLSRQNNITSLKERIEFAIANDVDVLSPSEFAKAKAYFDQAVKEAQKSEDREAGNRTASLGLDAIAKAERSANDARSILAQAIDRRNKAQEAQAHILYEREFTVLEHELIEAGRSIEDGNTKTGSEKNLAIANKFTQLELKALKANIAESAEKAYYEAEKALAARYAPVTLKKSKNELDIAKKIIDVEKGNFEKAQFHAERARALAMRAKYIAEMVSAAKKEHLTPEAQVLLFQDQLEQLHKPLQTELAFDVPHNEVLANFSKELKSALSHTSSLEERTVAAEKKIATLAEKLNPNGKKGLMEQATLEEHFREISQMFSKEEAEVVKRENDIVIRAHGFFFPVGKSNLEPRNFALLNKILSSVVKFPRAEIEVEGHTDSTGSRSTNMRLSRERAQGVSEFLTKVGGIDANRIRTVGEGDTKPLSKNDTLEGRSLNRRIDVVIVNQ